MHACEALDTALGGTSILAGCNMEGAHQLPAALPPWSTGASILGETSLAELLNPATVLRDAPS